MPEFAKPIVGNFCWIEANLEDPAKGRGFYGELFGWAAESMPMPAGEYSIFHVGGKHVAGLMKLPEEAKKMGAPPHWLNYVAVDDVAAMTKKAEGLGGKTLVPPMQVGPGTMSVIQDPTGAALALWHTTQSMGTFLWGEDQALGWTELNTKDAAKAKTFYTSLFGWTLETWPMGAFDYTGIKNGDASIGGIMQQTPEMAAAPSAWMAYFFVTDCDGTAEKAKKMGGNVILPPTDIPDIGRFAILADPQGAVFAIMKNSPKA